MRPVWSENMGSQVIRAAQEKGLQEIEQDMEGKVEQDTAAHPQRLQQPFGAIGGAERSMQADWKYAFKQQKIKGQEKEHVQAGNQLVPGSLVFLAALPADDVGVPQALPDAQLMFPAAKLRGRIHPVSLFRNHYAIFSR